MSYNAFVIALDQLTRTPSDLRRQQRHARRRRESAAKRHPWTRSTIVHQRSMLRQPVGWGGTQGTPTYRTSGGGGQTATRAALRVSDGRVPHTG